MRGDRNRAVVVLDVCSGDKRFSLLFFARLCKHCGLHVGKRCASVA